MSNHFVTAFREPEHRAGVIAAFEAVIPRFHDEAGVQTYALPDGPDRPVMVEKYEFEEAWSAHATGDALAGLLADVKGKLSRPLDVQRLDPHPFGDLAKGTL